MADDLLKSSITVRNIGRDKDHFQFKIPTIRDEIQISARADAIHKSLDPSWDGFTPGLDGMGMLELKACATLEILLEKSSAVWAFTQTLEGVKVDHTKFPANRVNDVILAYQGFSEALQTFRETGDLPEEPSGEQAVAGQSNS
jgi:hypothetical protein